MNSLNMHQSFQPVVDDCVPKAAAINDIKGDVNQSAAAAEGLTAQALVQATAVFRLAQRAPA